MLFDIYVEYSRLMGERLTFGEAARLGLCDRLVEAGAVRDAAHALAAEIAGAAPLAVRAAMVREAAEPDRLRATQDWLEGVRATAERRPPRFEGR